jgi:hypothetical protein
MTSFFDSAASSISVSLHGQIQTGQNANLAIVRDVARYQLLYQNMLSRMREYLNLYTDGSYNELKQVYTEATLKKLLTSNGRDIYYNDDIDALVDFTYDPLVFDYYKSSIFSMLTGFNIAVKKNDELITTTAELNEKRALLLSKEKLIEYINTQFAEKISMDAFYMSQKYNVNAILKPWFDLYLQLYGPPNDGNFNAEKMANVVEILVNRNIITIEDFMNGYL